MSGREPSVEHGDFEGTALPFLEDVSRFALFLTRDEPESDDLVQETFLRALRGWHTFRSGTDCRKWLFRICRNTFVRRRRRSNRLVLSEDGDVDSMPTVLSHVAADQEGLGDLFDQIDVRPAITRALNTLPEPHHSVLVLVDLEGTLLFRLGHRHYERRWAHRYPARTLEVILEPVASD